MDVEIVEGFFVVEIVEVVGGFGRTHLSGGSVVNVAGSVDGGSVVGGFGVVCSFVSNLFGPIGVSSGSGSYRPGIAWWSSFSQTLSRGGTST